jgi:hypothetical protein
MPRGRTLSGGARIACIGRMPRTEGSVSPRVRLRVHHLRVLGPAGKSKDNPSVFCPTRQRTVGLGSCLGCARLLSAADESIECDAAAHEDLAAKLDVRIGGDVSVGEVMGCSTVCVLADVTAATLSRSLKEQRTWFAVVVEGPDHFLGLVDLEAATRAGEHLSAGSLARHVQPVREAAPLAFAVERMVHERARALPVVDEEGFVVALISDIDALRWVANRAGKT